MELIKKKAQLDSVQVDWIQQFVWDTQPQPLYYNSHPLSSPLLLPTNPFNDLVPLSEDQSV